jgi:hypothetical protein
MKAEFYKASLWREQFPVAAYRMAADYVNRVLTTEQA